MSRHIMQHAQGTFMTKTNERPMLKPCIECGILTGARMGDAPICFECYSGEKPTKKDQPIMDLIKYSKEALECLREVSDPTHGPYDFSETIALLDHSIERAQVNIPISSVLEQEPTK